MCKTDIEQAILLLALTGGAIYATQNIWSGLMFIKQKTVEITQFICSKNSQLKKIQDDISEIKSDINKISKDAL